MMRYVYTSIGLLLVLGALVAVKGGQIGQLISFSEASVAAGPPPETVMSGTVEVKELQPTIDAVGTASSARGVVITSEVPGVVTKIGFDSGDEVKSGEVLVQLDTRVERAELAQAKARRDLAKTSLQRTRRLVPAGAASESSLDNDASSYAGAVAEVQAIQARLAKKTIRAPFSGRLGIRRVDLGQYLNAGTELTVLESERKLYVDFTLPQEHLAQVSEGTSVRIVVGGDTPTTLVGKIEAVEPSINVATRTLQLRASVDKAQELLRPGMFVRVQVVVGAPVSHVFVPVTAVAHASFGDSVFVVEPKGEDDPGMRTTEDGLPVHVAHQRFVKLGPERGDFVAVLDGLDAGQTIVIGGVFKLRNGAPIVINNNVDLEPSLEPSVENR